MDTLYWIVEYGKVFCGYMFLMFIWPSVVFSKHLQNKDKIYRFSFCVSVQVILINTVVLLLGLLHILNRWTVNIVFWIIFLASVKHMVNFQYYFSLNPFNAFYRLIMGTYGIKLFSYKKIKQLTGWMKKKVLKIWNIYQPHIIEFVMLSIVVIYGIIYFSYGPLQTHSYGFSDMYVHHQWIYGLIKGEIFSGGIYPEAMHCFVYCLHTLFGIQVFSCLQLVGGIHIAVFLISAYCLMREIFQWRYTPIFILIVFLILDTPSLNFIFFMSRLQWALPQEFGLYTQFLCALYLIRYLKSSYRVKYEDDFSKYYWDENLLLLTMSLAASIAIHFYTTIMAFLLCTSFALFALKKIFKKKYFFPLLIAVLCGVLIAALPMAGALASGKEFQGSIGWALNIIKGEDKDDEKVISEDDKLLEKDNKKNEIKPESKYDKQNTFSDNLKNKMMLFKQGYIESYGKVRAEWIIAITKALILMWIIYQAIRVTWQRGLKRSLKWRQFDGYMPIICASIIYMVATKASVLGLPQLIDSNRIRTSEHIILLAIVAIPIDLFFGFCSLFCAEYILQILSMVTAVGICSTIINFDSYHGYLGCNLTRYDSAVMVTNSIIENFENKKYTIVSPVDELYQVIQYGYHEELLTFDEKIQGENYKLPTEYVFLFVEKRPLKYVQLHLFQGPSWLGDKKYSERYPSISVHPEVNALKISQEDAQKDILLYELASESYVKPESRVILESKVYLWCQNFSKLHPFEVNVYYEDENFVCYYFKQNPYALYNLAIENWDKIDGIVWQ